MPDPELFAYLSEGLSLIAEHVEALHNAAGAVSGRSSSLLSMVASEEVGKFLILLDAVRVPRRAQKVRSDQLRRANDHLPKHLYDRANDIVPADFAELQSFLARHRQQYYLDGPSDYDWIFRNEITQERESLLYVDLLDVEGKLEWWSPTGHDRLGFGASTYGVSLVGALTRTGATTPDGLQVVADLWRGFTPHPKMQYSELKAQIRTFLKELVQRQIAAAIDPADWDHIEDRWSFPLYAEDLSLIKSSIEDLAAERERRFGAEMMREYGPGPDEW